MFTGKGDNLIRTLGKLFAENPPSGVGRVEAAQVEQLLQVYYRHIAFEDLEEHQPQDLLGALIAHWRLMRQRSADRALVRVYNPEQEEDGWRSDDTIVEVVALDMPFLLDSLLVELNRLGLTVHFTIHPVFDVVRDAHGTLIQLLDPQTDVSSGEGHAEAVIQIHVDRQPPARLGELQQALAGVIDAVAQTTLDWREMREMALSIERDLCAGCHGRTCAGLDEVRQFVTWMIDDHFLFIATCSFRLDASGDAEALVFESGSGLGMLRGGIDASERASAWISGLEAGLSGDDVDLMVTKANARSIVHRPAYMDCVAIKQRDSRGNVTGLWCLVGLFSSGAYNTPPRQIPLLRQKVEAVFAGAKVTPNSHSGRAVANILDNFPRDTLFQIDPETLLTTTLGVLALQERQRTRLFIVRDPFRRFFTCLVYLPKDRYTREVRLAIQRELLEVLGGEDVVFETQFSESILARTHYVVWIPVGSEPTFDVQTLEDRVAELATTWQDGLRAALFAQVEESLAAHYLQAYGAAFPGGYREDCHPRVAVNDIQRMERARAQKHLVLHLYHPMTEQADRLHVRLYSPGRPQPLSEVIPILENMGLDVLGERPYHIRHADGDVWIHDFSTRQPVNGGAVDPSVREAFIDTFHHVWDGDCDNDELNALVLSTGLNWRELHLIRAYNRYLHQIKVPYTQAYMTSVLCRHPDVVKLLFELFRRRFDPELVAAQDGMAVVSAAFESALEAVASLDEDRILRRFSNLILATLRTNFYQCSADGVPRAYLSFKIDPEQVDEIPAPRPKYEIFVYSANMEGVHLRGGKVARGGLRWSDRMQDYRTEILGLMKAQMVKNTVIVPVGSKGGFVVRNLRTGDGAKVRGDKVISAYQTLLRGMLDVTDNLVGGEVVPPDRVVRRDDDDPYLVIAADKGTASFSDIANQVAAEYGFWLGDAFASGGSAGYDHKAMGITARGAWESVKRNFRELGLDTQTTAFSVIGIGDMSGDVFGNGMLLSRHIRLLAAFNHKHVFLDPDPDIEAAYAERKRLFALPRSAWSDYRQELVSPGGGVYSRNAKSIPLSSQVQQMLGLKRERVTPNELIRALLIAPVDLLWNGGIGTYVKAGTESNSAVGDKSNDALRVNAAALRCRVVGEGGNLGLTQLARVEYALQGGQLYTDAIDNSAGVDCSDHEVNIKILLDRVVADGDMTVKQRNTLLADMTDDVARLVLQDNYAQTEAISIVVAGGAPRLYEQARFMDLLELKGDFDRDLEGLPRKKPLTERIARQQGLTKPEVAVLLAYSKMNYFQAIVDSDIPDDPFVGAWLLNYFPDQISQRFAAEVADHPLRREIVATSIAGSITNKVGPGIGFRVREEVGAELSDVTRAYLVVAAVFETDALWHKVSALDNQVAASVQIDMLGMIAGFLERALTGILRTYKGCLDMMSLTQDFHDGVQALWDTLPTPLASQDKTEFTRHQRRLVVQGVPKEMAQRIAGLPVMAAGIDIVDVAADNDTDIETTAWVYSALNHTLDIEWINRQVTELSVQTHWHLLARTKLEATLNQHRRELCAEILSTAQGRERSARGMLEHWVRNHRAAVDRYLANIAEFKGGSVFDFAVMSLVVARLGELLPTSKSRAAKPL